jgi:hypothetical protein
MIIQIIIQLLKRYSNEELENFLFLLKNNKGYDLFCGNEEQEDMICFLEKELNKRHSCNQ